MAWRVANSLLKLRSQVDAIITKRDKSSDGTIGNAEHATRASDHNPWVKDGNVGVVTAMDITHDPKDGVDTYKLAEWLRQNKDMRIKYVISNRKIFSFEIEPWQWRKYTGSNPHDQHIHISVRDLKSLYDLETPWNLGDVLVPNPDADPVPQHPVLKYDSIDPAVVRLQELLRMTPEYRPDERSTATRFADSLLARPLAADVTWFGPRTLQLVKDFQASHNLTIDGVVGPYTWRGLEGSTAPKVNRNIVATVFGGSVDKKNPQKSAYTGKLLNDTDLYCALPYHFIGKRPTLKITSRSNGQTVANVPVEDIGPWNTNDPYWTKPDGRPQAESGRDKSGRKTNAAGLDLSPAAAKRLGVDGKGIVDWSFDSQ